MITYIKQKLNKKDDTLPRDIPRLNVLDEKQKIKQSLSLYETQKQIKKTYSNPDLRDFPDTKPTVKRATNKDKIEFLKEFSSQYGYNGKINAIRQNEYSHMKGAVYLDHSGSTTYAKSLITSVCNDLTQNLFGNPHSENPSSSLSSHRVNQARLRVLQHFNASPDDYEVVFTQNATAALRMVGEAFPWVAGKSSFKYLRESHNSLLGIRALAEAAGLNDITVILESEVEDFINRRYYTQDDDEDEVVYSLFAYPAQCNFSGQRFPLNWAHRLKKNVDTPKSKHLVLLDAAAYAMTAMLSLANKETSPDFVAISFYKIFGFPTGLGALLVKKELLPILRKKYFGGGTVRAVAYDRPWQRFSPSISKRFEDGTINFLDIIALNHAFAVHEQIYFNFSLIKPHVTSLIVFLSRRMQSFVHWNGIPVCEIYTEREFTDNTRQGPVINFNIRRTDGSWVGPAEVERMASANGIHIRVGGLCNPGCIAKWVNITVDDIMETYAKYGMVFGNGIDYIKTKPAGGVRLSLGPMSTIDDVLAWLHFFKNYYVESTVPDDVTKQNVHQQLSPVPKRQSLRNSLSMQQLTPKSSKKSSTPHLVSDGYDDPVSMQQFTPKLSKKSSTPHLVSDGYDDPVSMQQFTPKLSKKSSTPHLVSDGYDDPFSMQQFTPKLSKKNSISRIVSEVYEVYDDPVSMQQLTSKISKKSSIPHLVSEVYDDPVSMQQLAPKISKSSTPHLVSDGSDDSGTSIETPQTLTRKASTRSLKINTINTNKYPTQRIYRSPELIKRSNVSSAVNRVYL